MNFPNPFRRMGKLEPPELEPAYTMASLDGDCAEITMYGEIVEERPVNWFTGEPEPGAFIIQSEFLRDLETVNGAKTLTIRMDSAGGEAGVAILIHNRLRDMAAKGTRLRCVVDGIAMSGGSLIMCACDEVEVNPSSLIMIHNASCTMRGKQNANSLRLRASVMDAWDKAQVSIYKRKTGLPEETISAMMTNTTFMTGAEAKEKGFADKLIEDAEPLDIAASADGRSLFVRGRAFQLMPGMFAPDCIPTVKSGAAAPVKTNKRPLAQTGGEGGKIMANNLAELRVENPMLAEALLAEAMAAVSANGAAASAIPDPAPQSSGGEDRVQAERKRLQDIDEVASIYDKETVWEAKYGEYPCTAAEMTYRAAQKAAQLGRQFLADAKADFKDSRAGEVSAVPPPEDKEGGANVLEQARADAMAFNARKKEVR